MTNDVARDIDFVLDWIARVENEWLRQNGKLGPIKAESIRLGGIPKKNSKETTTQEGETTMENGNNDVLAQRRYLRNRLAEVYLDKREAARKQFAIRDDEVPGTWQNLLDRIAAGKF